MKYFVLLILVGSCLITPVSALEFEVPIPPESANQFMPGETDSFAEALQNLLLQIIDVLRPEYNDALAISLSLICIVLIISTIQNFEGSTKYIAEYVGAISVASIMLLNANAMIQLGAKTISEMGEYGKLFIPVMTAAMAAEGKITTSAAIYTGAMFFSSVSSTLIANVFLPSVYFYIALSVANSAIGEDILKNMRDVLKHLISWFLKILLTIFTTYIGISGAVSGTTDAAALKATKVTISSFVPVVGGILSDASEAVLVSIGLAKNAAGIYGIIAILAIFLEPFFRIGIQYFALKITSGICSIFGSKRICDLICDFSTAMGLLLGMTGTVCVLLLISTVCFMKGIG